MPQMAPMSWLTLFLFFIMSMLIMTAINYYIYIPMMKEQKENKLHQQNSMNWKW